MELWNIKNLEPPPINSCKAPVKEIDVKLLRIAVKDGLDFFDNQPYLSTEAALLSRLVYKMKMKMRSSKEFKFMEKLSKVLRTYLQMDVCHQLKILLNSIPLVYKPNKTYILTKNMVDYVLVRVQGLGKTLNRIVETCIVAAEWTQQKLRLGHFWKLTLIVYAAIARIFVITTNMLKFTCQFYDSLQPFSKSLKNLGRQWLPDDYCLPLRLDEWLNIDWLLLEKNIIEIEDDEQTFLKMFEDSDDDVEILDEYIVVKDDFSECDLTGETTDVGDESVICLGEFIDVSDVESVPAKKNKRKRMFQKHCNPEDVFDVGEALCAEVTPQKKKPSTSKAEIYIKNRKKIKKKKNANRRSKKRYFQNQN